MAFDTKYDLEIPASRDYSAQFAPLAKRAQKLTSYGLLIGAIGFIAWLPVIFGYSSTVYKLSVFIPLCTLGVGSAIYAWWTKWKLKCPSCNEQLEDLQRYCPECGEDGLHSASTLIPKLDPTMHCDSCETDFMPGSGANRTFKIRYCGCCGVFLSNEGV